MSFNWGWNASCNFGLATWADCYTSFSFYLVIAISAFVGFFETATTRWLFIN